MKATRLVVRIALATTIVLGQAASYSAWSAEVHAPAAKPARPAAAVDPRLEARPRSMDAHIHQLDNRIGNALEDGRITAQQADDFRAAVGRIAEQAAEYRADGHGLSNLQSARLDRLLDGVSKALVLGSQDRQATAENLGEREDELDQRVLLAYEHGRITREERDMLLDHLRDLLAYQNRLKNAGSVGISDLLAIGSVTDLLELKLAKLAEEPKVEVPDLNELQAQLEKSFASEKANLDAPASAQISAELERIGQGIKKLPTLAAWQQTDQKLALAIDLERLSGRLKDSREKKKYDIDQRLLAIDHQIFSALTTGRLTVAEVHQFVAELAAIADESAPGSADSGTMPEAKRQRLALECERLSGKIAQTEHDPFYRWSGVDAFRVDLDSRINAAVAAKRLSEDDAKLVRSEIDQAIEQVHAMKAEAEKRRKEDGQTAAASAETDATSALSVAMKLQEAVKLLHRKMGDRQFPVLNLNDRLAAIDSLIGQGIESGRLLPDNQYQTRLEAIKQSAAALPADGANSRQKLLLAGDAEKLAVEIQRQLHGEETPVQSFEQEEGAISTSIANGVAMGALTVDDGLELRNQLDVIQSDAAKLRNTKGQFSAADASRVGNRLDRLAESVEHKMLTRTMMGDQVDAARREVEGRLGRAFSQGRLSIADADRIQHELDKIGAISRQARATNGGMSLGEGLKLRLDLARIAGRIETRWRDRPLVPITLERQLETHETKLAGLVGSGKISIKDADNLKHQIDRLVHLKSEFSESGGGLSHTESVALTIRALDLSQAIDEAAAKSAAQPDIDTRQSRLTERIKQALSQGKITALEAKSLSADLERISQEEASFRVSGEGLNYSEAVTLVENLERVSLRLDKLLNRQLSISASAKSKSRTK